MANPKPNFQSNGGKSQQGHNQGAERKAAQQQRGSGNFKNGSNVHNGASKGQSGQPKKR